MRGAGPGAERGGARRSERTDFQNSASKDHAAKSTPTPATTTQLSCQCRRRTFSTPHFTKIHTKTDRKPQELTADSCQVVYFFPPAHPVVCIGATSAARVPLARAAGSRGGREQRVGVCTTSARSSSRPARTCVQRVPVGGAGQGQERAWSGGTLCLSLCPPSLSTAAGRRGLLE